VSVSTAAAADGPWAMGEACVFCFAAWPRSRLVVSEQRLSLPATPSARCGLQLQRARGLRHLMPWAMCWACWPQRRGQRLVWLSGCLAVPWAPVSHLRLQPLPPLTRAAPSKSRPSCCRHHTPPPPQQTVPPPASPAHGLAPHAPGRALACLLPCGLTSCIPTPFHPPGPTLTCTAH
jgi:hypothetical protein